MHTTQHLLIHWIGRMKTTRQATPRPSATSIAVGEEQAPLITNNHQKHSINQSLDTVYEMKRHDVQPNEMKGGGKSRPSAYTSLSASNLPYQLSGGPSLYVSIPSTSPPSYNINRDVSAASRDAEVANSMCDLCCPDRIDSFFKITERGSSIGQEIRSGAVTFVTMAYILIVNAQVSHKQKRVECEYSP